jgi:hypothetical protein
MPFDIKGQITEIFNEVQLTPNFKKLEFVVRYFSTGNQEYPEYIKFELHGANTSVMDNYYVDDFVTVHFNLKGKKWVGKDGVVKWYNTFQAWKVIKGDWVNDNGKMPESKEDWGNHPRAGASVTNSSNPGHDDDDLPF